VGSLKIQKIIMDKVLDYIAQETNGSSEKSCIFTKKLQDIQIISYDVQ
jgi:hypothetical protein